MRIVAGLFLGGLSAIFGWCLVAGLPGPLDPGRHGRCRRGRGCGVARGARLARRARPRPDPESAARHRGDRFKLKLFGIEGYSFAASKIVGWIYSMIAVGVTIWAARRAGPSRGNHALLWLAVLILATLRSPFLPQAYAAFPPVWLLTLLAAVAAPVARTLAWTLLGWAALSIYWPMDQGLDPQSLALLILVPQTATIVVTILALRRSALAVK